MKNITKIILILFASATSTLEILYHNVKWNYKFIKEQVNPLWRII